MVRRGFTRTIAIIAVAAIMVALLIYVSVQPAIGTPDEARRIIHASGFSIVKPEGWQPTISVAGVDGASLDSIGFVPIKTVAMSGYFYVTKLKAAPDPAKLATYLKTTFHSHPAWEFETKRESTKEHSRILTFSEGHAWYEIGVRRPQVETITGNPWQAYFDSLKTPAPATNLTFSGPVLPH